MSHAEDVVVQFSFQPDRTDLAMFWKLYDIEQKFHAHESNWRQKIWGNAKKSERVCRYCKKNALETTFYNLAHMIPAMMGNKYLFSGYECDKCNAIFAKYENELANFSGVWHTISQVSGRGGVPKFKDEKNGFNIVSEDNKLAIYIANANKCGISFDEQNETISIKTFKPAFIPRDVLKCFLKIALGFLNEENLASYDKTRRWLIGEIHEDEVSMHPYFFVPRARSSKMFRDPMVVLMKKRPLNIPFAIPEHSLLIWYGIFIYQIYIPFNSNEETEFIKGKLFIPIEEHLCKEISSDSPLGAANVNIMNMGAKVRMKGVDENIVLPFQR